MCVFVAVGWLLLNFGVFFGDAGKIEVCLFEISHVRWNFDSISYKINVMQHCWCDWDEVKFTEIHQEKRHFIICVIDQVDSH